MIRDDPYVPGYTLLAPDDSFSLSSSLVSLVDVHQARWGYYPIEVLPGSDPLEFIVHYPYLWDPTPPEGEWSMVIVTDRSLDHLKWFEGEWHRVWGEFEIPVYRMI